MRTYRDDRDLSDRFLPAIKRIVGPYLLEESSAKVDQNEAADLVLVAQDVRIACRVRGMAPQRQAAIARRRQVSPVIRPTRVT